MRGLNLISGPGNCLVNGTWLCLACVAFGLCVGQSPLILLFFFFSPEVIYEANRAFTLDQLFHLGMAFYLQYILKDLFFGVDLGEIGVTHAFV